MYENLVKAQGEIVSLLKARMENRDTLFQSHLKTSMSEMVHKSYDRH